MIDKRVFRLISNTVRQRAIDAIWGAPEGAAVTVAEPSRNLEQNALLHKTLTAIAKQVAWQGQKLSVDVWKRLCTAAWLRERGASPMLVPALDGNGFDVIFERTSKLSKSQCSELIEWCLAFGAGQGVDFDE